MRRRGASARPPARPASRRCGQKGGGHLAEPPLRVEVLLLVTRTRRKARVAEPLQRAVDGRQGDVRPEFLLRDPLDVLAAEDADLVRRRRSGVEAGLQSLGHDALDLRAVAATFAGGDRLDAAVAIGVDPTLDEGATSRERLGDGERLASLDRLHDREQSITLLRVRLASHQSPELRQIPASSLRHMHAASCPRQTHHAEDQAIAQPEQAPNSARERSGIRITRHLADRGRP